PGSGCVEPCDDVGRDDLRGHQAASRLRTLQPHFADAEERDVDPVQHCRRARSGHRSIWAVVPTRGNRLRGGTGHASGARQAPQVRHRRRTARARFSTRTGAPNAVWAPPRARTPHRRGRRHCHFTLPALAGLWSARVAAAATRAPGVAATFIAHRVSRIGYRISGIVAAILERPPDMDFLDKPNPEQREAVLHTEGPLLILAGAGSGKTRVITFRIAYLIGNGHARADEVLAVTFTNKAAGEMRQRVEALLGSDAGGVWLSTFHSLCARLLRREAPHVGLSRDFVIYDSADQAAVVKQVEKELGIDDRLVPPRVALARISQAKNRMEGPDALRGAWNLRDEQIARIYEKYLAALRESNALDFDDLLLKTVELFETAAPVRDRYARKFKYVMVDEYQDTNRPQYLLIRRLAELHRNLAVVGAPDQSIYKWRGADLKNILDFETDFADAAIVRLEQNYRSTQVILDAATAVIQQNRNRKDKRLWTDRKGGHKIVYYRGGDELEEA